MADEHFIRQNFLLIAATLIASAIHYLFQFSMGRLLGPEDYGILAAFFSILYIAIAPVQAVQLTLTKFVAEFKAKNNLPVIKDLLARSIKKLFLVSLIVFFIFLITHSWVSKFLNIQQEGVTIAFSFIFLGFFITAGVRGFLQGMQKFKALGINLITESATKLVISLILVFGGFGVLGAVWGVNISVFVAFSFAAVLLFKMFSKYSSTSLDSKQKAKIYLYSIPMLIALSVVTALYSIDVLLVKHFFAPTEAGIYAAAALLAKIIFFGVMPISQVMFPKIAELGAKAENYSAVFVKSIVLVVALCAAAVAVYYSAPNFVLKLLFGPAYVAAVPLIGLFGIAISLLSISYVFINYFLSSGKTAFVYILPAFVIAEAVAIWFWHSSLYQVVLLITAVMAAMLAVLIVIYLTTRNYNF